MPGICKESFSLNHHSDPPDNPAMSLFDLSSQETSDPGTDAVSAGMQPSDAPQQSEALHSMVDESPLTATTPT